MQHKTITRKDAILDSARLILIEEGHYRLTMRHLAERVGMKLASLQYHFPTKAVLISALMTQSIEAYHSMVRDLVRSIGSKKDEDSIGRLFAIYRDEQASGVFEQLWALSVQDPDLKKQYEGFYVDFWELIGQEVAMISPEASENECRTRSAMIIALLDGLETFVSADQLEKNLPDNLQNEVVALIIKIAKGE